MATLQSLIAEALVASGHTVLDDQAKALGLPRSTTWTIVASKHKLDRISKKVRARMLSNPELPPLVRAALKSGANENGGPVLMELTNHKASFEYSRYVPRRPKTIS